MEQNLKGKVDAIIFDLDGTLTPDRTSWQMLCEGLGIPFEGIDDIYFATKRGEYTLEESRKKVVSLYRSTGKASKLEFQRIIKTWDYRKESRGVIKYLNSKGYEISINSAAFALYVKYAANYLGIEDWYTPASFVWDEEGKLKDIEYVIDQEKKKVHYMNEFLRKYGLTKERCAVVADGDNDIELFKECAYSIIIGSRQNPDFGELGLININNLNELKELF